MIHKEKPVVEGQVVTDEEREKAYTDLMADLGAVLDKYSREGKLNTVMVVGGLLALTVGVAKIAPPFSLLRPSDAALTRIIAMLRQTWAENAGLVGKLPGAWDGEKPVGSG